MISLSVEVGEQAGTFATHPGTVDPVLRAVEL